MIDTCNGDVGIVERIDTVEQQVAVRFDERLVKYDFGELDEISLAYAMTIHKSQGSEFPAVVIPLATQHYMLLQRNLIYAGQAAARSDWAEEGAGHRGPQRPTAKAILRAAWQPERRRAGNNHDCALWNTKKNTITLNAPNA
jgi:hypothetical protein